MQAIKSFIQLESTSGLCLFFSAVLALLLSNSPWHMLYSSVLNEHWQLSTPLFILNKPLFIWINEGLMTLFFFLIGLEIKREMLIGHLNTLKKATLPGMGALGGMLVPALGYLAFTHSSPLHSLGWAIPTATDIAFSLAILSLLGSRIPLTAKVFLTALAIFDDLGAIIIIAIFYTQQISMTSLSFAFACILLLCLLNRCNVRSLWPYLLVGLILWSAVLSSGIHATLAGVIIAYAIPLQCAQEKKLEHRLHPWVAYLVLPIFAFANAGIHLTTLSVDDLLHPVSLGIALGLLLGKQLGITSACYFAVSKKMAHLPTGLNWSQLYGISLLCGVGFTMSLFIGILAYEDLPTLHLNWVKIGVFSGSLLSGLAGYLWLRFQSKESL